VNKAANKAEDKAPSAPDAKKPVVIYVGAEDINVKKFAINPCEKNVLVMRNPPYGVSR
jgi:hypothetical protein